MLLLLSELGNQAGGRSSQQPIILSSLMCPFNLAIIVGGRLWRVIKVFHHFHALATSSSVLGYCGLGTLAAFIFAKYCAAYSLEAFSNSSGVLSQALLGGLFGTFGRGFDFRFGDPFFRRVPLAVVLVRFRFWLFG